LAPQPWGEGTGQFAQYEFQCAEGTVFDPELGVCNWPALVPGCSGGPKPEESAETTVAPDTTVVVASTVPDTTAATTTSSATYRPAPGAAFQCTAPGILNDEEHCNKFWLCKEEPAGSGELQALLYRCPAGFLFSSAALRCRQEEDVSCVEAVETRDITTIQLTVAELEPFFAQFVTSPGR